MKRGLTASLAALAILGTGVLGFLSIDRILERQRTEDEINALREELFRSRAAADRCRGSLQTSQAALVELSVTIDSLKRVVDDFESLPGRGVPAASYDAYMSVFEEYNDSVGVWEGRESRLRSSESACRATIQDHNLLTDSLQRVLATAGILPDGG